MIKQIAHKIRKLVPALAATALLAGCGATLSEVPMAHMEHPPLILPQSGDMMGDPMMGGGNMMPALPQPSLFHGGQIIAAPAGLAPIHPSPAPVAGQQQFTGQMMPQQMAAPQPAQQMMMPSYNYGTPLTNHQPNPVVIQQPPIVVQQPPITIQQPPIMVQSPQVVLKRPQINLKPPTIIQNQPNITYQQ